MLWQVKDEELLSKLFGNGIPAQLIRSQEAEKTQRKVGVCICEHAVDDFGLAPYMALSLYFWDRSNRKNAAVLSETNGIFHNWGIS